MIGHKRCLDDPTILPDRDHGKIFHIEIDGHRDQVGISFALFDLLGLDFLHLREVQRGGVLAQDQFGALVLPGWITPSRFKIAVQVHRVVLPFPSGSGVDLEPGEAGAWVRAQVGPVQVQTERFVVESGMIGGSWQSRLSLVLARGLPVGQMREVGTRFANGIFDHRAAVDERELGELVAEVVGGQRMGMGAGGDGEGFGPGQQFVGGDEPLPSLLMLL